MFRNFALGLDLKSRFVAVTELDTSAFVQIYQNKYMARKMEGNMKNKYKWLTDICRENTRHFTNGIKYFLSHDE
jgi:hypothetical protein